MTDSYYELLELQRGLPNWKLTKRLYEVEDELKDVYGGDVLPDEFDVPLKTLGDPEERDRYDSFLEWAEEGSPLDFGVHADAIIATAESVHHFSAERLENGCVVLSNRGVKEPPPPPPPPQRGQSNRRPEAVAVDPPSQPAQPKPQQQTPVGPSSKPDQYGRVNGRIPPIHIGSHVYTISFVNDVYLESAIQIDKGLLLNWAQTLNGRPNRFAWKDHNAHLYAPEFLQCGGRYSFLSFTDAETQERTDDAYIRTDGEPTAPLVTTVGLWKHFPWPAKYLRPGQYWDKASYFWSQEFPHRYVPGPAHFGREPWDDDTYRALAKYLEEVVFWGRAAYSNWTIPVGELRPWAKKDAGWFLSILLGMKPRQIRKLGLPSPG